ncbi:MAG: thioredoxin family protein [Planctomycetes bacterium]|nr:thioredoxin family protein [Planctomycetota bacterium]
MLFALLSLLAAPQEPVRVAVALEPHVPQKGETLAWSPKGATVPLRVDGEVLVGSFALGPKGSPAVAVRLERSPGQPQRDVLWLDLDRNGQLDPTERLTTTPKETRGKWWSSFEAVVAVPFAAQDGQPAHSVPYALGLWFVFDPAEPNAAPTLRWTRRGYSQGRAELGGVSTLVLVTEMELDGVITTADSWALATEPKQLLSAGPRALSQHCWLETKAWRAVQIAADGRHLLLEPFDPRTTEAEEKAKADAFAADRTAARAAKPLGFGTDFAAALATAKQGQQRVLVDFATTWCGPCKAMDELVYTAEAVVAAAKNVVCVKLDGDQERELVKRFGIAGYPTMLLLGPDGSEVRRLVGYQGVAAMVAFLAEPATGSAPPAGTKPPAGR